MQKVNLGKTDLNIPPIVFGGNVFGWTLNEEESFRILDEAFDKGFSAIDTADSYSHWAPGNKGGESEVIIGKWQRSRNLRDKLQIFTKVGSNPGHEKRNLSKNYILKTAEESLRRLRTDYIDLYFTHWDDPIVPVEETLEAYHKLIKDGKVRYIGASNLSPERLEESLKAAKESFLPTYSVFQPEFSLAERDKFSGKIRDICVDHKLGVISYFSLASGFLTGKYRKEEDFEGENRKELVKKYANDKGYKILQVLDEISTEYNVSNAAVALHWIMKKPYITAPIASATKSSHLKSFAEAVNLKLTEAELEKLDKVSQ